MEKFKIDQPIYISNHFPKPSSGDPSSEKINPLEQYTSGTLSYERYSCQGFLKKYASDHNQNKLISFFQSEESQLFKRYF